MSKVYFSYTRKPLRLGARLFGRWITFQKDNGKRAECFSEVYGHTKVYQLLGVKIKVRRSNEKG